MHKITRREFIKQSTTIASALAISGSSILANAQDNVKKSTVVIAKDSKAITLPNKIETSKVKHMLDESIKTLSGKLDVKSAWLSFFPNLQINDVIAIKVNCINTRYPTHPPFVDVITKSLVELGVNENNIIIYDRLSSELKGSGYTINTSDKGVRCFGSSDTEGIGFDDETKININGQDVVYSKVLSKMCNHLINVPVLRDHVIAGITFALKSHYGSIPLADANPPAPQRVQTAHSDFCKISAELYNVDIIKNKTRLIIGEALWGIYQGGPSGSPQWINNQIILGTDPVATDYQAMMIIDNKRKEKQLPSLIQRCVHINLSAELGLGTNDPQKIDLKELNLG